MILGIGAGVGAIAFPDGSESSVLLPYIEGLAGGMSKNFSFYKSFLKQF